MDSFTAAICELSKRQE